MTSLREWATSRGTAQLARQPQLKQVDDEAEEILRQLRAGTISHDEFERQLEALSNRYETLVDKLLAV